MFRAVVAKGSVATGVIAYLREGEIIEDFPLGAMVKILGQKNEYIAIITDAGIDSSVRTMPSFLVSNADEALKGAILDVFKNRFRRPWIGLALIAQRRIGSDERGERADSMPSYYSKVLDIEERDVRNFFSQENRVEKWYLGSLKTTSNVSIMIPIDVSKLIQLHFGIFGKTGTGKTFLGNLIANMILLYERNKDETIDPLKTKLLIFDMHSEYVSYLRKTGGEIIAEGVGTVFKGNFIRYSVDPEESKKIGVNLLKINLTHVLPADIALIGRLFGLTSTFINHLDTVYLRLKNMFGKYWFLALISLNPSGWTKLREKGLLDELISKTGCTDPDCFSKYVFKDATLQNLKNTILPNISKLAKILRYEVTISENDIETIIDNLVKRDGYSVIISFGRYEKETVLYMLLANFIARSLREKIMSIIQEKGEPETRIIIFLEEAHYFLSRENYYLSPFGEIAREMRKRGVTLCIIDQKPSELDPDVISMLWTNFVFNLTDKNDISAAIYGAPNASLYSDMIPRLRKREVFIFGEAADFPVVLSVRDYKTFVSRIISENIQELKQMKQLINY